jgi:mono/diheme cytochrome c family protein
MNNSAAFPAGPWAWFCGLALAIVAGCGHPQVRFSLNREGQPPAKEGAKATRKAQDQAVVEILETMFGTPDEPYAWGGMGVSGLDERKLLLAAGPADDSQGRGLYRKHCVHCHGVTGDGYGPTARFLNPYPRDFRLALFKFKSTAPEGARPTREDLTRTVREGINGTAMPSFKVLLRSDEIDALAEYVVYLSVRGRTERQLRDPENDSGLLTEEGITSEESLNEYDATYKKLIADLVASGEFTAWTKAQQQVFVPPPRDEALIAKEDGARLFAGAPGKNGVNRVECLKCHGPTALGDGGSAGETFDKWNEPKFKLLQGGLTPSEVAQRFNLPLQRLAPRNLRLGVYRGGQRRAEVFRRIALGIFPSGMPAHASIGPDGKMDTSDPTKLQPHEIWALVDYVMALPYGEDGELRRERHGDVAETPHRERP